jgi:hypothetical protein
LIGKLGGKVERRNLDSDRDHAGQYRRKGPEERTDSQLELGTDNEDKKTIDAAWYAMNGEHRTANRER